MPRKLFKKYLPSHDSIKENRFIGMFGKALQHHNLWHLHRRGVAGGVAVGLFAGLIPGPLQILTAAILSVVFKVNLPVATFVTFYSNPLTIVPIYLLAYRLGAIFTGNNNDGGLKATLDLDEKGITEWIPALVDWMSTLGKPLAVGLPLLAIILAVSGYFAVLGGWRLYVIHSWKKRRHARQA
ncbi:MAG: DUF2062 domain-containing protein [Burkholderiales bacterium]